METFSGEDQAWLRVMEVATLCSLPMALKAVIHLHVLDILALQGGGGEDEAQFLTTLQIVSHFGDYPSLAPITSLSAAASFLDRILRVLASHGLLSSSLQISHTSLTKPTATYALNSLSRYLLQTSGEGSLAPLVLFLQDPICMQSFFGLHESVIDSTVPFTKVHGIDCFSYFEKDARLGKLFNEAMFGHTKLFMQALLKTYTGFKDISSLVDVGGGLGTALSMVTSMHPHIKGINFDLPHVIKGASQYPGVEHVGGDMFLHVPKGEVIFMKWILHDWNDELCLKLLENCYNALPTRGKVIVVDAILPDEMEHHLRARTTYQMDLLMFAYTGVGKERTEKELLSLSKASGFSGLKVICNIHGCSVLEIFKGDF